MSSVGCNFCEVIIVVWPTSPMKIGRNDDGSQYVETNWSPVYEHMRDNHPEKWTPDLAQEYEAWKAGKL